MNSPRTTHSILQKQGGAAFIVMLVILIMGVTIYLVSSLSKVTLQTARNEKSSDLLSQAKDVVIGYALNGTGSSQRPGDLMIPDVLSSTETPPFNYDGVTEGGCLDASKMGSSPIPGLPVIGTGTNMRCLGRLPWKSISMPIPSPTDNDPTGFMPWYAVSANLVDPACVSTTAICSYNPLHYGLNSEILNAAPPPHPWLTVRDMNGNVLSNRVAFVIIIPGPPLPGQSRPPSPNLGGANQYLDSITVPATCTAPCIPGTYSNADMDDDYIMGDEHRWISNAGAQIDDPSYNFNDKLLYVTIDDLMPLIEKRIAREVKSCLDDYAAYSSNTNHKYPWAALVSDTTPYPNRAGTYNTLFGRVADIPSTSLSGIPLSPTQSALQNQIFTLQTALTSYLSGTGSLSNLKNAGDTLKDFASNSPYNLPNTAPAVQAGSYANNWSSSSTSSILTNFINSALNAISPIDTTLPSSWAQVPSCNNLILISTYWPDWRDLVFYQVANSYQPTGAGTCVSCLSINGSGNPNAGNSAINGTYHASIALAGKRLSGQTIGNTTVVSNYLESSNQLNKTSSTPTTVFETYKVADPNYLNVNDLVLCLDGKLNCQ